MFFRREKPRQPTFEERTANLKKLGFEVQKESASSVRVTRDGCGAVVEDKGNGAVKLGKAGVLVNNEITLLVNAGYQMFLQTPSGKDYPALASHLKTLHEFEEDLREGLGLTSLYNMALGTTSDEHIYDRVEDRDEGVPARPWQK